MILLTCPHCPVCHISFSLRAILVSSTMGQAYRIGAYRFLGLYKPLLLALSQVTLYYCYCVSFRTGSARMAAC
ncbi:hypothetical protein BJX76DRAFT_326496 [Aspergillus varians]